MKIQKVLTAVEWRNRHAERLSRISGWRNFEQFTERYNKKRRR
jgi:hypothetical protein